MQTIATSQFVTLVSELYAFTKSDAENVHGPHPKLPLVGSDPWSEANPALNTQLNRPSLPFPQPAKTNRG